MNIFLLSGMVNGNHCLLSCVAFQAHVLPLRRLQRIGQTLAGFRSVTPVAAGDMAVFAAQLRIRDVSDRFEATGFFTVPVFHPISRVMKTFKIETLFIGDCRGRFARNKANQRHNKQDGQSHYRWQLSLH
jgi:hypothetical protein